MPAIVTAQSIDKSFGSRRVLSAVSFAIDEQDRIGLIGVNGSGKSTLLRLIAGGSDDPADGPDAGLITRRRALRLEYVPQEPRFDGAGTVAETLRGGLRAHTEALAELARVEAELPSLVNARLDAALERQAELHQRIAETGGWDQEHEIRGLAAALELPPLEATVATLSIGEKRRVALARALLSRPELLALDEPTNHLDARTVEWLEERLRGLAGALLLVTHDRYFLDRVATRILELDRGRIYAYEGNYSRFLEKQAARLDEESGRERARASFVRRELDWIRRGPKARGTKQQARIDRFDAAVAAAPTAADKRPSAIELELPMAGRLGKTILELVKVTKAIGGKKLFEGLDLLLKPGDRIGIVGENGAGKTTLVRAILGEVALDAGQVIVGQNTSIACLDQARAELNDAKTVLAEVAGDGDFVMVGEGPIHVRTFLRRMGFEDGFADTPVGSLSGGERNRVQLAKLLRRGGNLIILDEPTNDLDLVTLGVLEGALAAFPGCALIVSHDRWFLDRVATGILAFEGQGRVSFFEGNYSSYFARRRMPSLDASASLSPPVTASAPVKTTPSSGPRKLSFKEKQELAVIEGEIAQAEARVSALEAQLSDPSLYQQRGAEVPALTRELAAARAAVDALYTRWQALEALR